MNANIGRKAKKTRPDAFPTHSSARKPRRHFEPRICACGCGIEFRPTREWQDYVNAKHRKTAWATRTKPAKAIPDILRRLEIIERKLGIKKGED